MADLKGLSMKRRALDVASLFVVSAIFLNACVTRSPSDRVFNLEMPYQTPDFSLAYYKSPELRAGQEKDVSVAVAISGGGHRAGNFGVGVLKELERIQCSDKEYNALKEVDYFSTVSGGGIAAGAYISSLFDHEKNNDNSSYSLAKIIESNRGDLTRNLERGYHNVLVAALVNIRALGLNDRGDFLEEEFDIKLLGSERRNRSLNFGDVFVSKESSSLPKLPIWVANATVYENGSIFTFHPKTFEKYQVAEYTHHLDKWTVKGDYYSIPLSIGLKASASFPGAVPATTLKSTYDSKNQYLHLFDGGLSDNLGIYSALQMLGETDANKKVLIVVDAYNGQSEPFSKNEGSPTILQIFFRSTDISLDASHIRHRTLISHLSRGGMDDKKIDAIYLSFDDLPSVLKGKVNDIGTNFNISVDEQAALFEAAKLVVKSNKSEIVGSIFGDSCM